MASYDDGGIYYTCLYAEDYGNDYWCDYYRIATLYDGWTVNQGTNIYTPFDDLDAMTNPIDNGDEFYHCNAYTFMCIYTSFDSYYVLATTTNYYYVYNYSLYIQFADYVSDSEWYNFYDVFLKHFQSCDKDKNNSLNEAEIKDCFKDEKGPFKNIH